MVVLAYLSTKRSKLRSFLSNQIFNRHSMHMSIRKLSRRMSKIVTDKRQSQLSEPIVWPLCHSQKGQFLSQEEVGGIVVIKHH